MAQHDSSYHLLFSHPDLVEDLVRNFVPEEWVQHLDFTGMQRVNAKFHTEGMEQRDGDLIYRIPHQDGDGEIYLYLLLEFQSKPDKWMALRIMVYTGLLYQQIIKEKQLGEDSLLPPVFPLVLYNGDARWRYPLDVQSLIALPRNSALQRWQPNMQFFLLEENQYPDGKEGSTAGTIMKIENSSDHRAFRDAVQLFDQQIPKSNTSLRRIASTWIGYVIAPHKGLKLEKRDIQDLSEVTQMLSDKIPQWEQEFIEKGRKEGRKEGVEKGEAILLSRQLELKFGSLPDWAQAKIAEAHKESLENWGLKLLNASSLDEVFE